MQVPVAVDDAEQTVFPGYSRVDAISTHSDDYDRMYETWASSCQTNSSMASGGKCGVLPLPFLLKSY